MKKLWNKFQNFVLRKKLLTSYLVIAIIPLGVFSLVIGIAVISSTRNAAGLHTEQVAYQMSESLDIYIGTIEKMMDYEIKNLLEISSDFPSEKMVYEEALEKQLNNIHMSYPEMAGIMVAYEDDRYYSAGMTRNSRDLFVDEEWYQIAVENNGKLGIVSTAVGRNIISNVDYSADMIFSLVKRIPATEYSREGVLLFDIRHDIIEQLINRASIGENGFVYVVDSTGNMVYAPANDVVYRVDEDSFSSERVKIKGEGYYIADCYSDYTGWRCVGVIPDSEYIQSTYSIYLALMITVIVCGILVVVVAYLISASITKPLASLQRLMAEVENGDFSIRFKRQYDDEIGMLGSSFNHMLEKIDELVLQVSDEKKGKLAAQLKSLQEQFKPHFLYNTLDTIAWMARAYHATDVVKMLEALTTIFRVGLSGGRDYITVREERMHVENYLYIQKIRYNDKLRYEIDIPEELYNISVPKLILQPLAENAIYHGLKLKREGGTVKIRGYEKEGDLWFEVQDDGVGVSKERLMLLQEQLLSEEPLETKSGFGLFYIAERVRLCYGSRYNVTIDSVEGEMTVITVRLPIEKYVGGKTNV